MTYSCATTPVADSENAAASNMPENLFRFLDVLSGIPPKTCASIAPNTGMRKRRGRQRDTATGIGDS
ncbi:hypothetical protein, partial [Thiolapillus sp.]|uniref:hypothetical protein n=1 Tax=Thiolapillus sp. TaxID=2017437 RepID=UPI003AF4AABE